MIVDPDQEYWIQ